MALETGTRLGPYEITSKIGSGGMGEVYRATDTKLGRDVAIKTLPAALAEDRERLIRFEREAKVLASLNHPHIASVHSLDEQDGTLYIAMELVEGQPLDEKLKDGAMTVTDALPIALQIAEALEAAHDKGVIHRDLKPANIMLTETGQVKVLDFGLAKAFAGDPASASALHSPALSVAMTQAGLVLGTAGYMSPEQASGQATDQRADIWSFGVVLYEMLTGLPLFKGESVPHILADVLKTEPDWRQLPSNLHPRLKLLLERCLTKKPHARLHSMADARIELEAVLADPEGVLVASSAIATERLAFGGARVAAAIAIAAIIAAAAGWFLRPIPVPEPEPKPITRFSVPLAEGTSFTANLLPQIAVSPDGARIAYVANNQIYLRNLAESDARPVPGTQEQGPGAAMPTFSPDGQWIAYMQVVSNSGPFVLKRIPISGGSPVRVHEAANPPNAQMGLTWPTQDTLMFTDTNGIVRIPANGGATEVLIPRAEGEQFLSPQLLPGGDALLFTTVQREPFNFGVTLDDAEVVIQSIGSDDRTVIWEGGTAARYLPTGHLVYAQGTSLYGIAFDIDARAATGGSVQLIQTLSRPPVPVSDSANVAVSETGTLVQIPGLPGATSVSVTQTSLTWVDRDGREEPLPVRPDDYSAARISPDGTRIALVIGQIIPTAPASSNFPSIWIYDLRTENLSLLTADPAGDDGPVWSNDSRRIYFRSLRNETVGVYVIDVETGETQLIAEQSSEAPIPLPWSISPDDQTLALITATSANSTNLATLSIETGEFSVLLSDEANEFDPSISPNGEWLAYQVGFLASMPEVNIRPFPGVSRTRIPVGPGGNALFSRDGTEVFLFNDSALFSVPISYEPALRVGRPERLFQSQAYAYNRLSRAWDADPSGERFLMIRVPGTSAGSSEPGERPRIDVVLNWFEELKTRIPTAQ